MHPNRLLVLALLVLACLPAPLLAEAELEGRFWLPEMDGTLRISEAGQGTEIKLPGTLGFEDDETGEVRLTWRMPGPVVVRFGYLPLSYSGRATISEAIEFGTATFPIAFDVASQLDIDYARVGLGLLFRVGENFRIGPIGELKALRADAELTGSVFSIPLISAREARDSGFLSIGVAFEAAPMATLQIVGEVDYAPALDYGELTEAELGVKFTPIKVLSIFLGYRLMDLDLEVKDDTLALELSGPYFGASLTF